MDIREARLGWGYRGRVTIEGDNLSERNGLRETGTWLRDLSGSLKSIVTLSLWMPTSYLVSWGCNEDKPWGF
jgi:hypothetical protein